MTILSFRAEYTYGDSDRGIEIPVMLTADSHRSVLLLAKVDTGAADCIFQRDYGEQLGIAVESGTHKTYSTVTGSFDAYGHRLRLSCLEWEYEAIVYFAASPEYRRNVLGRAGWLQQFRLAIVDHDSRILLSHYDDQD